MSFVTFIQRFILANVLTVFYTLLITFTTSLSFLIYQLKNLGKEKPASVPPAILSDPKYGVHKYVKANNVKLHYVEKGDPNKPLMLFLHGFPEFWFCWRHQIVEFSKDYWCVAPDMRGYADSEKPEGVSSYKIEVLVEDIRDFMRKLGRNKCILVGHDWGGIIATKYRDTHPETLDALILLASISQEAWNREIWGSLEQNKKSWYTFFVRVPVLPELWMQVNNVQLIDYLFSRNYINKVAEDIIECFKYIYRKPGAFTSPINYYRANFHYTFPDKYIDNKVPMLVANAELDDALAPGLLNRMKEEYKYIETVLVRNSHHFYQEEEPEKANKIIRDFLAKNHL